MNDVDRKKLKGALQELSDSMTRMDAEKDLQNRGAGDLFGFQQHGFDTLRFASWTNLELIQSAHLFFQKLKETSWQPFVQFRTPEENAPVAN